VFFMLVLVASWLLMPRPVRWKPFMLLASYVFYGAWDWRFVGLLIAVTVVSQTGAVVIARVPTERQRQRALIATLGFDLGLLAWFKYYGFFATSLANLLGTLGLGAPLPLLEVILPVGISFFTFQAISYVIDVYRGDLPPAKLLDFAVYLAFFPQLVAGPIVRATEFIPQLRRPRDPRHVEGARGFMLIARGLFKKVVVANLLATSIVDPVFSAPASSSALEISSRSTPTRCRSTPTSPATPTSPSAARCCSGFRFPQNFDRPYTALSLQDFWRRWHMTLSRWLRDYLYIPLGGNAGGGRRTYRNLFLTMLLGGLWHGAAWTFVVWGAIHGLGLAFERTHRPSPMPPHASPSAGNARSRWWRRRRSGAWPDSSAWIIPTEFWPMPQSTPPAVPPRRRRSRPRRRTHRPSRHRTPAEQATSRTQRRNRRHRPPRPSAPCAGRRAATRSPSGWAATR
jgi:alginate O-acetyltransferase complex protein AlgI